jgi:hypothetical protein
VARQLFGFQWRITGHWEDKNFGGIDVRNGINAETALYRSSVFSLALAFSVASNAQLRPSGILDEFPKLAAYLARGEARPACKRAFAAIGNQRSQGNCGLLEFRLRIFRRPSGQRKVHQHQG